MSYVNVVAGFLCPSTKATGNKTSAIFVWNHRSTAVISYVVALNKLLYGFAKMCEISSQSDVVISFH